MNPIISWHQQTYYRCFCWVIGMYLAQNPVYFFLNLITKLSVWGLVAIRIVLMIVCKVFCMISQSSWENKIVCLLKTKFLVTEDFDYKNYLMSINLTDFCTNEKCRYYRNSAFWKLLFKFIQVISVFSKWHVYETLVLVVLCVLHGCFSRFLNCTNGITLRNILQIYVVKNEYCGFGHIYRRNP